MIETMGGTSSSPMDSARDARITQISKILSQVVVNQDRSKRGAILDRMVYMFSKDASKNIRYIDSRDDLIQLTHPTFGKSRGFLAMTLKADDLSSIGTPVPTEIRERVYTGYTYITYLLYLFSLIFTVYPVEQDTLNRLQDFESTITGGLRGTTKIGGSGGGGDGGAMIDKIYSDLLNTSITTASVISSIATRDGNALYTIESSSYTRIINTMGDTIRRFSDPLSKKTSSGDDGEFGDGRWGGESSGGGDGGSVRQMKGLLFWQQALNSVNYLSFCDKSSTSLRAYLSTSKNAGMIDMMIQLVSITIDKIRSDERIRKAYSGEVYALTNLLKSFKTFETVISENTSYQEHQRRQLDEMAKRVDEYCSIPRVARTERPVVIGDRSGTDDYRKYVKSFSGSAKALYDKIASAVAKLHIDALSAFDSVFTISPTRVAGTICFPIQQSKVGGGKTDKEGEVTGGGGKESNVVFLCVKRNIIEASDPEKILLGYVIQTAKSVLSAYGNIFYYLRYDLDKLRVS